MSWLTEVGRRWWLTMALAVLWVGITLVSAGLADGPGFPLDDAWIHQTYAGNLAESGRWEYLPGEVSAGSTAPLWTLLLAAGYVVGLGPFWWTWCLGTLLLALCGWLTCRLAQRLFPGSSAPWAPAAVGLLCVSEWHLVWAAVSGMETLLFVALSLLIMERAVRCLEHGQQPCGWESWAGLGLAAALLILTRPEGLMLAALVAAMVAVAGQARRDLVRAALAGGVPFVALLVPYLWFNYSLSGRLWPNTFYAKQAEYGALMATPLVIRLARVLLPPLTGFQLLLVPGVVLAAAQGIRQCRRQADGRRWLLQWLPLVYATIHVVVYAWRLPVTYQHGRYLVPVIPPLILYGGMGTAEVLRMADAHWLRRLLSRTAALSVAVLLVAFVGIGAGTFSRDVRLIEGEMVTVARWLAENTAEHELVAAHDIGAIGYFAGRPILDLAGLISPEVGPLLGDEEALAVYVLESPARYLVSAPGWPYTEITSQPDVELLFDAECELTQEEGVNSSAVYRLP